jgi:two-component system cell cycle response regulator DivK
VPATLAVPSADEAETAPSAAPCARSGRPPTILVVDDQADIREVFEEQFRHLGADVLTARDGVEALDLASRHHPDALLLDLSLPRLSGWQVAERLKKDPLTSDVAIVALSGYVFPGGQDEAHRAGADLYLTKPCLPHVAYAFILDLLYGETGGGRRGSA